MHENIKKRKARNLLTTKKQSDIMNQSVWKFRTPFEHKFNLEIPKDFTFLSVGLDEQNHPCIWVLVYPENEKEDVCIELFGTGMEIYNDMGIERQYIGTYKYQNGAFMGHLFHRIN